jgi:hypothetical protein
VGFEVGPYDRKHALVIDPVLSYSSYLGGSNTDAAMAVAVGANGSTYIAGNTASANFPISGGVQGTLSSCTSCVEVNTDIFIAQLDASGRNLVYATYIGGGNTDTVYDLALDGSGNVYVTGSTASSNFPITGGAYKEASGGTEVFFVKLNAAGTHWCTRRWSGSAWIMELRSMGQDTPILRPCSDGRGSARVSGHFRNVSEHSSRGGDAFVTKLANGGSLVYSTLLGGTEGDYGRAIAVDAAGQATIVEHSNGPPTADAFVARVNVSGSGLVYWAELGGSGDDFAYAVALDSQSNAYVTGSTASVDFPTTAGAYRRSPARGFLSKVGPSGTIAYSTYFGTTKALGTCPDAAGRFCGGGFGIAVDGAGQAYAAGTVPASDSSRVTTADALLFPQAAGWDAFILRFNAAGSMLSYGTTIGGAGDDIAQDIAIDASGDVYMGVGEQRNRKPV